MRDPVPKRIDGEKSGQTAVLLAISSAIALAFFAMVGFEDSVNMAEETVDPPRTFPRAMLLAMGITATIYLVVALLASTLVPTGQLAAAQSGALLGVVLWGVNRAMVGRVDALDAEKLGK